MISDALHCHWLCSVALFLFFFFSSRRRHTRLQGDWSSDVCSSDLFGPFVGEALNEAELRMKVKEAQMSIASQGNLTPVSVNTYSRTIQTFWNWLLKNGQINRAIKLRDRK